MSAWKLATRELVERGPLRWEQFMTGSQRGLREAATLGMVMHPGNKRVLWAATQLGVDWSEGRIAMVIPSWKASKQLCPVATWLMARPRPGEIQLESMHATVDFAHVADHHQAIDARLANWARWSSNRSGGTASPMFRLYRSAEVWGNESALAPVDGIDAQKIQKAVGYLPTPHRLALSWCYIKRNNPRKAAISLGETMEGMAKLIDDARQMLINRRA